MKKSDEQPPKDGEKSPTSIKARFGYVAINTGILLVITTALSPLLVFIALPNLFIITGQRPRMEEYFWQAFWFGTALTDTIFFIYLCRQYRRGGTFREASTSTLGGLCPDVPGAHLHVFHDPPVLAYRVYCLGGFKDGNVVAMGRGRYQWRVWHELG